MKSLRSSSPISFKTPIVHIKFPSIKSKSLTNLTTKVTSLSSSSSSVSSINPQNINAKYSLSLKELVEKQDRIRNNKEEKI